MAEIARTRTLAVASSEGTRRDDRAKRRIGKIGPLLGPGPAERPTHPHGEVH